MQELQQFKVERISIHLYCGSLDGGQKNAHQPLSRYYIIETSLTYLAHNSVLIGPNNLTFVQRHVVRSYMLYQNLVRIYHNLHSLVFNDDICKPPTGGSLQIDFWQVYTYINILGGHMLVQIDLLFSKDNGDQHI